MSHFDFVTCLFDDDDDDDDDDDYYYYYYYYYYYDDDDDATFLGQLSPKSQRRALRHNSFKT